MFGFHRPSLLAGAGCVQSFGPNGITANTAWTTWHKPRGISMVHIFAVGHGGYGGDGWAGAASAAYGGGGGASGSQVVILVPAHFLPDSLYLNISPSILSTNYDTRICVNPSDVNNDCVLIVTKGAKGTNGGSGSAGVGGAPGALAQQQSMPLGWAFLVSNIAGQVGVNAGAPGNNSAPLTLPTTGLRVTAGTGGGTIGAAGAAGGNGGAITTAGVIVGLLGGPGGAAGGANAGGPGMSGGAPFGKLLFYLGGTGGGATGLTGTPTGANGGNGGRGAPGCGGGGGGAAFTGHTAGLGTPGGESFVIITCW